MYQQEQANNVHVRRLIPTALVIEVALVFTNVDKNASCWFSVLTKPLCFGNIVTQKCISYKTGNLAKWNGVEH